MKRNVVRSLILTKKKPTRSNGHFKMMLSFEEKTIFKHFPKNHYLVMLTIRRIVLKRWDEGYLLNFKILKAPCMTRTKTIVPINKSGKRVLVK